MRAVFCRFDRIFVFGIFIPAYDVAGSRRILEIANDTIDDVLVIYVSVFAYMFFSVVPLFVFVFAASIRGFVGVSSAGYSIYADGILASVMHDANDLWSANFPAVRA